jgi:ABC-2 type transport system permease protein
VPREDLPYILKLISNVMPLSYAIDATNIALQSHKFAGQYLQKIFVVVSITIGVLVVGAVTLPRQSK